MSDILNISDLETRIQIEREEVEKHGNDTLGYYAKGKLKAYEECYKFIKNKG